MMYRSAAVMGTVLLLVGASAAAGQALPVKDGRPVVAGVNGEWISLDEFVQQMDPPVDTERLLTGRATPAELELLDRMVTVRLVVQEAATMGVGDLPEIQKQVDVQSKQILRDVLTDYVVRDVRPDETAVEQQYKDLVREYRTASLLFTSETAAAAFRQEVERGRDYAVLSERAIADKAARAEGDTDYHQPKDYLPEIAKALAALAPGEVSPVLQLKAGFVVVKLVDVRFPENADARAEALRLVLVKARQAAFSAYEDALRAKEVVVHEDVLKAVDYEAKEPGMDALLKDTRVVAEIAGREQLTVGDLTDYLRLQFFHGGDTAGQLRRMNSRKQAALNATISRRLLNLEAARLGLDKTAGYLDRVGAFEDSLVFESFVQKVIAPESGLKEDDVRAYYDAHRKEFSSPEMFRLRSLAFSSRSAAEDVLRKLREGAEPGWLASTAEGQVDKQTEGLLTFDGRPVTTDSMPEDLRTALADAKAGDHRLYASPDGPFYALSILEVIEPDARPFDEVKLEIAKKLYGERLRQGLEAYAAKLRAQSKVETYLAGTR